MDSNAQNKPEFLRLPEDNLLPIKAASKLWEISEKLMPRGSTEINKRIAREAEHQNKISFELLLNPEWKALDLAHITDSWMFSDRLKLGKDLHESALEFQNEPARLKNMNKILEGVLLKTDESATQRALFRKHMPKTAELFSKRRLALVRQKKLDRAQELEYGYER